MSTPLRLRVTCPDGLTAIIDCSTLTNTDLTNLIGALLNEGYTLLRV